MSKEDFWAEADIDEMGDVIRLIRVEHLNLTVDDFSRRINAKPNTVEAVEAGTSAHGLSILKKTCETFDFKFDILISTKEENK